MTLEICSQLRQGVTMQMEGVSRREAIQTAITGAALLVGAPAFAQRAPGSGYPVKKKEVRMANANYAPVVSAAKLQTWLELQSFMVWQFNHKAMMNSFLLCETSDER